MRILNSLLHLVKLRNVTASAPHCSSA